MSRLLLAVLLLAGLSAGHEDDLRAAKEHAQAGRHVEALAVVRRAVARLPLVAGGLAHEEGARRETWAELFDIGARSALALDDPDALAWVLESGRAGSFLESLGGRGALARVVLPQELRVKEAEARAAMAAARARYRRDRDTKSHVELARAEDQMLEAVASIQRAAKAAAEIVNPQAATLATVRRVLREGEALVIYGRGAALVATATDARAVSIEAPAIPALHDRRRDPKAAVDRLRRALVDPLRLDRATTRVLISPSAALAYVPFALLLGNREVAYVPSATAYTILRADAKRTGHGVLALGGVEYGRDAYPLPGTRHEVQAVGDVVLTGGDATADRLLAALGERPRWRSVHVACHSRIDTRRPMLSSLVLGDRPLTVLQVMRLRVAADLVVLSAGETARGKAYRAEGVVGFPRAFMLAGAPRVLVSLWKIDDAATRALMEVFYAEWKRHSTAAALRRAQEHIRSHEKWRHPYYWAAWQLWGLPE